MPPYFQENKVLPADFDHYEFRCLGDYVPIWLTSHGDLQMERQNVHS